MFMIVLVVVAIMAWVITSKNIFNTLSTKSNDAEGYKFKDIKIGFLYE